MKTIDIKNYGTVNFGKHKGELWSDIPIKYLEWMQTEDGISWNSPANVETARKELLQRHLCQDQIELF